MDGLNRSYLGDPAVVRKAADEQLEVARSALDEGEVHALRKAAKRLRAFLRLAASDLGKERSSKDDRLIRDLARAVSDARDAQVTAALFDDLVPSLTRCNGDQIEQVRARLHGRVASSRREMDTRIVSGRLDRLEGRIQRWETSRKGVKRGFDRTLRRCREGMGAAERSLRAEELHGWRKQVKYHWHQCELLGADGRAKLAHALSDELGDEHDLVVLLDQARDLRGLEHLIASRRLVHQERALELGQALFMK